MTAALLLYLLTGLHQPKIDMSLPGSASVYWIEMGPVVRGYVLIPPCGCSLKPEYKELL